MVQRVKTTRASGTKGFLLNNHPPALALVFQYRFRRGVFYSRGFSIIVQEQHCCDPDRVLPTLRCCGVDTYANKSVADLYNV